MIGAPCRDESTTITRPAVTSAFAARMLGNPPSAPSLHLTGGPNSQFALFTVEHQAANNLGPELARHLGTPELEHGSYRNRFSALSAASP